MSTRPKPVSPHLVTGVLGEEAASRVMEGKGYNLLERNWRSGHLELDLIFERGEEVVFVEVKTRSTAACGGPLAGITKKKTRNIARAAQAWITANDAWDRPCRLDIICLTRSGPDFVTEHLENAIELSHTLDNGDSSREYW
ncbi:MAG: YraN family protein [Desulfovibrio sp.]|nr:YraN family protein [Desulfovibrio sp.]